MGTILITAIVSVTLCFLFRHGIVISLTVKHPSENVPIIVTKEEAKKDDKDPTNFMDVIQKTQALFGGDVDVNESK